MMRNLAVLSALSVSILAGGCVSARSQPDTPNLLSGLYGTWTAERVPVSGQGHFEGISTHEYNANGTFRSEAEFTVADSGCHVELHYVGNYTGDRSAIQVRPTGGEVEVTSCRESSQNAARRSYDANELRQANSTVQWEIRDGILSLRHADGMERTFRRQRDVLAGLYGTWATNSVAVSGHGQVVGEASHNFNQDGSYRWEAVFTHPESGCRGDLHYSGRFAGNAHLLRSNATSGEVEVTGCSDNSRNAARRQFSREELAAASDTITWNVSGNRLVLSHADGLQRNYARR